MLEFIKIYNLDGSYNSLLNVNYIIKIKDAERTINTKNNKIYIPIEYYFSGIAEALITEKDYQTLTINGVKIDKISDSIISELDEIDKKKTTKKTTKKEEK